MELSKVKETINGRHLIDRLSFTSKCQVLRRPPPNDGWLPSTLFLLEDGGINSPYCLSDIEFNVSYESLVAPDNISLS